MANTLKRDLKRLTVDLGQAEIVRHNYAIVTGWSEGMKVDWTDKEIQAILATADNYDLECHSTFMSAFNALFTKNRHAHTFLEHDSKHQSYESCVMMSLIRNMKCEHGVVNYKSLCPGNFQPSLIPPSIRRLPKNLLDKVSQLR
ncbi:hypothetical protein Tco_0608507 [Tanacetum coccineum]